MAHPDEQLVRSVYDAFARGDLEAVLGSASDDVVIHSRGRNPLGGDHKGVQGVRDYLVQLAQRSGGTFQLEVQDVLASDAHTVGLVRVTAQREGRQMDMPVVHVCRVRDGKLAEVWIHPLDQHAVDEFWA